MNTLCKSYLYHSGTMGMHWGYRHYQPYSAGYQAQQKGVFLGQLADKLSYGATYAKGFLGSLFSQGKNAAKKKFDQWNQIDTSATHRKVNDLLREQQLNQQMANRYRDRREMAYERWRREGKEEGTTTKRIHDTLESLRSTYDARSKKAGEELARIYQTNNPNLDTKTKRIASSLSRLLSMSASISSRDVSSLPKLVRDERQDRRIRSAESQRRSEAASGNVAAMLTSLAGLEKQQTTLSAGQLASWIRDASSAGHGTHQQRAIDYEIQRRQKAGYRDTRESLTAFGDIVRKARYIASYQYMDF